VGDFIWHKNAWNQFFKSFLKKAKTFGYTRHRNTPVKRQTALIPIKEKDYKL